MTLARQSTGRLGEDLACAELRRRGYVILARGYRTRFGELDIVARSAGVIVFVEVKTRRDRKFGHPAEAVTSQKQQRVSRMAQDYLARHASLEAPCRFDVVAVELTTPPTISVITDAFRPGW